MNRAVEMATLMELSPSFNDIDMERWNIHSIHKPQAVRIWLHSNRHGRKHNIRQVHAASRTTPERYGYHP